MHIEVTARPRRVLDASGSLAHHDYLIRCIPGQQLAVAGQSPALPTSTYDRVLELSTNRHGATGEYRQNATAAAGRRRSFRHRSWLPGGRSTNRTHQDNTDNKASPGICAGRPRHRLVPDGALRPPVA
ncbi:hypothetical protein LSAT2_011448 [Lamellibrachia satsuma]|nr:hypothetical protein LSAT2_011448 [Lamellibrachia satsuma]